MTATENQAASFDLVKWIAAISIIAVGVFGYYHFDQYPVIYRAAGLLPVLVAAIAVALWTKEGALVWNLMKESRAEIRKVVWPNRQETTQTTLVVVVVVFLMSILLWLIDIFFGWLAALIIG